MAFNQSRTFQLKIVQEFLMNITKIQDIDITASKSWFRHTIEKWNNLFINPFNVAQVNELIDILFSYYTLNPDIDLKIKFINFLDNEINFEIGMLIDLQRYFTSVGAFELSYKAFQKDLEMHLKEKYRLKKIDHLQNQFRSAIFTNNLPAAQDTLRNLKLLTYKFHINQLFFLKEASRYLRIWNSKNSLKKLQTSWGRILSNNTIIVIGPAPINLNIKLDFEHSLIAGRLGSVGNNKEDFNINNRNYLAYIDEPVLKEIIIRGYESYLNSYKFVSCNFNIYGKYNNFQNFRVAKSPNRLFLGGAALKIPLILNDLMDVNPLKISLLGTSFFLGSQVYRKSAVTSIGNFIDPRDIVYKKDFYGRGVLLSGMAAHNIFQNFIFVKNIAHRFDFIDHATLRILKLSVRNFAKELELDFAFIYK